MIYTVCNNMEKIARPYLEGVSVFFFENVPFAVCVLAYRIALKYIPCDVGCGWRLGDPPGGAGCIARASGPSPQRPPPSGS